MPQIGPGPLPVHSPQPPGQPKDDQEMSHGQGQNLARQGQKVFRDFRQGVKDVHVSHPVANVPNGSLIQGLGKNILPWQNR